MSTWEALNWICTLVGYAEARYTQYKMEEIAFAKIAQGSLKEGHWKLKSNIEI